MVVKELFGEFRDMGRIFKRPIRNLVCEASVGCSMDDSPVIRNSGMEN